MPLPSAKRAYGVLLALGLAALLRHGLSASHTATQWAGLGCVGVVGGLAGWSWSRNHAQPAWSVEPWHAKREWALWGVVLACSLSGVYPLVLGAVAIVGMLFGLIAHWKPMQPTTEEAALRERRARVKSWITVAFILA